MATTMFFEKVIKDAAKLESEVSLEFGRSSFLGGENLIYLNIDGKFLILPEQTGRELYEAMESLGGYLGYNRARG